MNLTKQEAIYGAVAGALIGIAYTVGRPLWNGTPLADITAFELLAAAAIGAAAGLVAFALRKAT